MSDVFAQPDDATPLDAEEREGLLQTWITTRADLNEAEQANIDDAVAWIDRRRNADLLTEGFVFELHKKMFGDVWSWAGSVRKTGKNIGIDPQHIHLQLGGLLRDVQYWIEHGSFSPDEIAVRLHHGLVAIDLPPIVRTVLSWNFPFMIPFAGRGEFHEEIEVYGCTDSLCAETG